MVGPADWFADLLCPKFSMGNQQMDWLSDVVAFGQDVSIFVYVWVNQNQSAVQKVCERICVGLTVLI